MDQEIPSAETLWYSDGNRIVGVDRQQRRFWAYYLNTKKLTWWGLLDWAPEHWAEVAKRPSSGVSTAECPLVSEVWVKVGIIERE